MTGTRTDECDCTHVGEWADLIGDEVPDRALKERLLRWPGSGDAENDCEPDRPAEWPGQHEAS